MITYKQLGGVRRSVSKLPDALKQKVIQVIERAYPDGEDAVREAIFSELAPVSAEADELAAQMAAAVYNHWRYAALGLDFDTVMESAYDESKIKAMANTAAKAVREGETVEAVINIVNGRFAYDIRKSYGDTMIANSVKDDHDVRFARVPGSSEHYFDGCPFCRMLASRGFVYANKETAGEFNHYHADCTCEIVSQFDDNPKVEGYDPDKYLDEYYEARRFAEDNAENLRAGESVGVKVHARYKNGMRVGARVEDYGNAKYLQANDISAAYVASGMSGRTIEVQRLSKKDGGFVDYSKTPRDSIGKFRSLSIRDIYEKSNLEAGNDGNEYLDLFAHDTLAKYGFVVKPRSTRAIGKDGRQLDNVSLIDIDIDGNPWEIKSPTGGNKSRSVESQLKRARDKNFKNPYDDNTFEQMKRIPPVRVVLNTRYVSFDDTDMEKTIIAKMRQTKVWNVIHVSKDGSVTLYRRK